MAFNLEKFFDSIFKPAKGEIVTVMYDLPHGSIPDRKEWKEHHQTTKNHRLGWFFQFLD